MCSCLFYNYSMDWRVFMKTIGERIIFLRQERDMSQKELAYTIHIAPTSLSRYEHNYYEPKAEILFRISKALNTTSDFLLGLTDVYQKPKDSSVPPLGLTAEEHRLLSYYRRLNHANKTRVFERAETLLDMQKSDDE